MKAFGLREFVGTDVLGIRPKVTTLFADADRPFVGKGPAKMKGSKTKTMVVVARAGDIDRTADGTMHEIICWLASAYRAYS